MKKGEIMKNTTHRLAILVAGTLGALVLVAPVRSFADSYRWQPREVRYHDHDFQLDRRELWHDRAELRRDQQELRRDQRAHRWGEVAQDRRELWNDRRELQQDEERFQYNRHPW